MADYRQIHTRIWKDGWFLGLEPEEKLLFIYMFSNERASVAGIYELPLQVICFETGLDETVIENGLKAFSAAGKLFYEDDVDWVVNQRNIGNLKQQQRTDLFFGRPSLFTRNFLEFF